LIAPLLTASRRFYLRHPLQLLLAILGVALGVAVFVGVDLANDSARRAFEQSEASLVGSATHQLIGVSTEIPNEIYRELRLDHGPLVAAPVVETEIRMAGTGERSFTLIGIDPLEELDFRNYSSMSLDMESGSARLIVEPDTVLIPASLSDEFGIEPGSSVSVSVDRRAPVSLTVVGLVGDQRYDPDGLNLPLVADIATVQEMRNSETLTRIDVILTPDALERLENLVPPGIALVSAPSRSAVFDELSRAFRINLTALSLLALLVGIFLIYATMSFAVLQRRSLFGTYRALGVRRRGLLFSVLCEASAIGGVATFLGIVLGYVLAQGLVELMLRTIGDLYFSAAVRAVEPSSTLYWKGLLVGVGTSMLAALVPALEATSVNPRTAMSRAELERTAKSATRWGAKLAVPCLVFGIVALAAAPRSLAGAFFGLFLVILASALIIPSCAAVGLRAARPAAERAFGVSGSLAIRGVTAALSRTGVATAALAVAVATVIGVGLMIGSFRGSVEQWLEATLLADLYADVENWDVSANAPLDGELGALASIDGVRGISLLQFTRLTTELGEISVRAIVPGPDGWGLTILEEGPDNPIERMVAGEGILVSETLAYRRELAAGDELTLPTSDGPENFTVLGTYRAYNTDGGGITIPLSQYQTHWRDRSLDGIGIYIDGTTDRAAVREEILAALEGRPDVRLRSTQAIRSRSLEIFDQTFRITEVLRILAGLVAFLGLLSALLAIELDRGKEVAVLRALGFTPLQIGTLSLTQTVVLGTAAGILAIPLGIVMAGLLVEVINQRSFGWGMDLVIQPAPLALGVVLAVAAALLAGIYPAWRMTRSSVAARLREE
jgi:putative ABC transport system permease protein